MTEKDVLTEYLDMITHFIQRGDICTLCQRDKEGCDYSVCKNHIYPDFQLIELKGVRK